MNSVITTDNINNKEKFTHFLMSQCLNIRRWAFSVSLLLYLAFSIMDVIKFPSVIYTLTITTRVILVILPLLYLNFIYWLRPPVSIRSNAILILLVYLGSGLNHALIFYISTSYGFQFSQLGIILIFMFGCLLFVLPIKPSAIVTVIILSVYAAVKLYTNYQLTDLIFELIILSFVASICLTINRVGQKTLYQNYLLINRLYYESITDGLTKLNNRRAFQEQIERLNAIANRDKMTLGLIFIDADYFKVINDSFGHSVGDEVLQKVANLIASKCRRTSDIGFRIGGDEFAIILYGINSKKLAYVCREIVTEVASFNLMNNEESIKTSVSLGAALKAKNADTTTDNLIELADEYLYKAKKNGRNQFYLRSI
tara:strand:+ start:13104 stop:14213 length:1110 start_codon:yes stop_codon:yes gene_type:complete